MGGTLQEFKMEDCNNLPAGFRFYPTDVEIIDHYLLHKVMDDHFVAVAMGEVDLNNCEPWDLPKKAKMVGESEFYFYCLKDRKYPTGTKTNRATEAGFWKATGKDKKIFRGKGVLVGLKKTLVFHTGRAPMGQKTNWIMHEYRLAGKSWNLPKSAKFEWVVCRIFNRRSSKEVETPQEIPTPEKADGKKCVTLDSMGTANWNCSFKSHQFPFSQIPTSSTLNPQPSMQVDSFVSNNTSGSNQKMEGEVISAPALEFQSGQQSYDQIIPSEFLDLENMWRC